MIITKFMKKSLLASDLLYGLLSWRDANEWLKEEMSNKVDSILTYIEEYNTMQIKANNHKKIFDAHKFLIPILTKIEKETGTGIFDKTCIENYSFFVIEKMGDIEQKLNNSDYYWTKLLDEYEYHLSIPYEPSVLEAEKLVEFFIKEILEKD